MEQKSGNAQAGEILLLVGAILAILSTVFLLGYGVFMNALVSELNDTENGGPDGFGNMMTLMFVVMGTMSAIGSALGFVGWNKARAGDYNAAFGFGLACALLPPLQVIPLLGAIFCKVSEEAQGPRLSYESS